MRYLLIPGLLAGFLFLQSCNTKKHGRDGDGTKSLKEFFGFSGEYDDIKISDYADFSDSLKWPKELSDFYRQRDYRLAWMENKTVSKNAKELLDKLRESNKEGLFPSLYNLTEIQAAVLALKKAKEGYDSLPRQLAHLDLRLTKAYLDYASDLFAGRINPEKLGVIWETYPENLKLSEHLREALEEKKIAGSLDRLKPGYNQYRLLKDALNRFTSAKPEDGWNLAILNDSLRSIIFNPAWNVPSSIATKEMLPKIKEDPDYLARNNYTLLKGLYNSTDTVDAEEVDWSDITAENFPFSIIQPPGKSNPLGKLEFMMQNQYNIYLHDTPSDYLFERNQRDFSHGCVRLEKPVELAELLLKGQLPSDSIRKMLAEDKKRSIALRNKVPVHMIYQTTWVDQEGQVQFRNDIYGFDKLSLPLLREKKQ